MAARLSLLFLQQLFMRQGEVRAHIWVHPETGPPVSYAIVPVEETTIYMHPLLNSRTSEGICLIPGLVKGVSLSAPDSDVCFSLLRSCLKLLCLYFSLSLPSPCSRLSLRCCFPHSSWWRMQLYCLYEDKEFPRAKSFPYLLLKQSLIFRLPVIHLICS